MDLAVGFFPAVLADLTAQAQQGGLAPFDHQRLYAGEYVCVMREGHPLARGPMTLKRYCDAHHLLVSFSGPSLRLRRRGAGLAGPQAPHRAHREPVLHCRPGGCGLGPAHRAAAPLRQGHGHGRTSWCCATCRSRFRRCTSIRCGTGARASAATTPGCGWRWERRRKRHSAPPVGRLGGRDDNRPVKIQLLSDLHLEVHPHYQPRPAPGADLLVLAGDIGSYQAGSLLAGDDFGLERFSPQARLAACRCCTCRATTSTTTWISTWPTRACAKPAIAWASPGWSARSCGWGRCASSARRCGPISTRWRALTISPHPARRRLLRKREKAFRAANYYLRKTGTTRHGEPMLAEGWREQALVCQQWLRQALAEPFDGTTVVVTHFAPSLLSADPRYGLTPGTAGFCNSLDDVAAPGAAVAAWPSALPARLHGRRLPRRRQYPGLCGQGRAGRHSASSWCSMCQRANSACRPIARPKTSC